MANTRQRGAVVPALQYRDAAKAIDWLCSVLGFERQMVVPNDDGSIAHAQLTFGSGMVMVSSVVADGAFAKILRQPDEYLGAEVGRSLARFMHYRQVAH